MEPLENLQTSVASDRRIFEDANSFARDIADQNQRYVEIKEIFEDEPVIKELVIEGLMEEQRETFANLSDIGREGQAFERLGQLSVTTASELSSAQQELVKLESDVSTNETLVDQMKEAKKLKESDKLKAIVENVERLSPKSLEKVKALLSERTQTFTGDPDIGILEDKILHLMMAADSTGDKIENLESDEAAVCAMIDAVDSVWELPRVLLDQGEDLASILLTLDELPVEPRLNTAEHSRYTELSKRHVDQPNAALYTAFYLTENAGETVTVDKLVEFLYSSSVLESTQDAKLRSRVTTILGPVAGGNAKKILEDDDYVLQYGWRRTFGRNDKQQIIITNVRRIYRVIKSSDLAQFDLEEEFTTEDISDKFDTTDELQQKKLQALETIVKPTTSSVEQVEQEELSDTSVEAGEILPRLTVDDIEAAIQSGVLEDVIEDTIDQPSPVVEAVRPVQEKSNNDWEKLFKIQIGETITELEAVGLLNNEDGQISKNAQIVVSSSMFATDTAFRRLTSLGITNRYKNLNSKQLKDVVIPPADMIIMRLMNRNKDTLGNKKSSKQKRAVALIEESLASFFKAQHEK